MKKLIYLSAILVFGTQSFAASIKSTHQEASVYARGGMLTHEAMIPFKKGSQEFLITGVSASLEASSIVLALPSGVSLLSVGNKLVDIDRSVLKPEEKGVLDSLDWIQNKLSLNTDQINSETFALQLLKKNDQIIKEQQGTVTDVMTAYKEYKRLSLESLGAINKLNKEKTDFKTIQALLNNRKTELGLQQLKENVIELIVQSEITANKNISFSYYTTNCGWNPSYVISSTQEISGIDLDYKALVYQNSGFDWKDVKLSIATGNPNFSSTQPTISTWFIRYYQNNYAKSNYNLNKIAIPIMGDLLQ